jgi:uncharacterized membrane protein YozB (DUF420 family)
MKNKISAWKRMLFIALTLALAFLIGYVFYTGGNVG